ncbi:alpha/beta hydrolase [Agromyces sp. H3Y2-19a]|uniref:alpha/beta hydrolase n=1 Tax=Agromyces chromiiresistens TaxID=3030835 RepID=UPI0023B9F099|nr:alpha/beta hydrolase [Agromyces chromiiresistens]MDF0512268.1 alpha/beta hydrolase [Agromyces chromiiresistens]
MTSTRRTGGSGVRRKRVAVAAAAVTAAIVGIVALSGFHQQLREIDPPGPDAASEVVGDEIIGIRTFTPPEGLQVDADLEYGVREDGTLLTLDVCRPAAPVEGPEQAPATTATSLLPAVVSIHGGSWTRGDKANTDWRNVCMWLASEGFVAVSVNYRLVPDTVFPGAIDDVALAVEWLRAPEQVERFGIDPARIGAFGGSAGGNLAALLGTTGDGALDAGSRVAAVAELSGPVGLGSAALDADGASDWLRGIVADYLGCEPRAADAHCPQAMDASPAMHVDPSDPPVFIGHSEHEIVPLGQSTRFAAVLEAAGVPVELAVVPGGEHSIGILDEALRVRVAAFLHAHLG